MLLNGIYLEKTRGCYTTNIVTFVGETSPDSSWYGKLVLSTGLIIWIGHRREIRKLTFRALALRRSKSIRSDAWNVSFRTFLRWPIHVVNPVVKTNLPCYTSHRRSTAVSLETFPSPADMAMVLIQAATGKFLFTFVLWKKYGPRFLQFVVSYIFMNPEAMIKSKINGVFIIV